MSDESQQVSQADSPKPQMVVSGKGNIIGDFNQVVQNFLGDPRMRWYLLGLAGLVIGASLGLYFLLRTPPVDRSPMTGLFNIAVAGFTVEGETSERDLGTNIAGIVCENLTDYLQEFSGFYGIETRCPDRLERINGSAAERVAAADRIARSIYADLVVYGTVKVDGSRYTVMPEFYINPDQFPDYQELTGQYQLGESLTVRGPVGPAFKRTISREMFPRMQVLTMISTGLSYQSMHQEKEALLHFEAALAQHCPGGLGCEVLYLFAGNAAGQNGENDLAEKYFNSALAEDPEYSRARIGLGSVYFQRALQDFAESQKVEDLDLELLERSIKTYESALTARNRPESADIELKVNLYLGRCYYLQAFAGVEDSYEEALDKYQAVTLVYETETDERVKTRIQELAGEAYGLQGRIYQDRGEKELAIEAYQKAVELLAGNPDRQKIWQDRLDALTP